MNTITKTKLTAITLALITLSSVLAGCGSKVETTNAAPANPGTSSNPEYRKKSGGQ